MPSQISAGRYSPYLGQPYAAVFGDVQVSYPHLSSPPAPTLSHGIRILKKAYAALAQTVHSPCRTLHLFQDR